jgi:aryl carrier-like protein
MISIAELPRNPSGKVLKTKLRELAGERVTSLADGDESSELATHLNPPTLKKFLAAAHASEKVRITTDFIRQQVIELSDAEPESELAPEDSFVEVGMDSLAMVSLGTQLQVEVGSQQQLPPTLLFDHPRLGDLAKYIVSVIEPDASPTQPPVTSNASNAASPAGRSGTNGDAKAVAHEVRSKIEDMSEEEALAELMKELD